MFYASERETFCSFISSITNRALRLAPKELQTLLDSIIPEGNKLCRSFKHPACYNNKVVRHVTNLISDPACFSILILHSMFTHSKNSLKKSLTVVKYITEILIREFIVLQN